MLKANTSLKKFKMVGCDLGNALNTSLVMGCCSLQPNLEEIQMTSMKASAEFFSGLGKVLS